MSSSFSLQDTIEDLQIVAHTKLRRHFFKCFCYLSICKLYLWWSFGLYNKPAVPFLNNWHWWTYSTHLRTKKVRVPETLENLWRMFILYHVNTGFDHGCWVPGSKHGITPWPISSISTYPQLPFKFTWLHTWCHQAHTINTSLVLIIPLYVVHLHWFSSCSGFVFPFFYFTLNKSLFVDNPTF